MADVVDLDTRRPHRVGVAWCGACGRRWVSVCPASARTYALECPGCGGMFGVIPCDDASPSEGA